MSSTNKTSNYGLNNWIASDIPKREDFNNDNAIIDNVINEHISNTQVHISDTEKEKWNNYMHICAYNGNGESVRVIPTDCNFKPRFAVIFCVDSNLLMANFSANQIYSFFAVASVAGSSRGALLSGTGVLTVLQETSITSDNIYYNLNRDGKAYTAVLFR